jgi:hypothetical protein
MVAQDVCNASILVGILPHQRIPTDERNGHG